MCPWYFKGRCERGPVCRFAHSDVELRKLPNLHCTSLCPKLLRGSECSDHDTCKFAHSSVELRATDDLYKTSLCFLWMKGRCDTGEACRHAHGMQELRPVQADGARSTTEMSKSKENVLRHIPMRSHSRMSTISCVEATRHQTDRRGDKLCPLIDDDGRRAPDAQHISRRRDSCIDVANFRALGQVVQRNVPSSTPATTCSQLDASSSIVTSSSVGGDEPFPQLRSPSLTSRSSIRRLSVNSLPPQPSSFPMSEQSVNDSTDLSEFGNDLTTVKLLLEALTALSVTSGTTADTNNVEQPTTDWSCEPPSQIDETEDKVQDENWHPTRTTTSCLSGKTAQQTTSNCNGDDQRCVAPAADCVVQHAADDDDDVNAAWNRVCTSDVADLALSLIVDEMGAPSFSSHKLMTTAFDTDDETIPVKYRSSQSLSLLGSTTSTTPSLLSPSVPSQNSLLVTPPASNSFADSSSRRKMSSMSLFGSQCTDSIEDFVNAADPIPDVRIHTPSASLSSAVCTDMATPNHFPTDYCQDYGPSLLSLPFGKVSSNFKFQTPTASLHTDDITTTELQSCHGSSAERLLSDDSLSDEQPQSAALMTLLHSLVLDDEACDSAVDIGTMAN
eukprot:CAMPEP_0113844102 /NCGR_PEP_ID=MMETSP0372-20130328/67_1 /TAXON_ID=340204 /ORGANISM="Lankesteria abbotti" /LENGTH=614 /DNA_ID=CAMNT_0000813101 /DNA_START=245 /DNA_END=2089 /DNA_ORIENTATION=+ /assembly_acc=CAM_ASM_000359